MSQGFKLYCGSGSYHDCVRSLTHGSTYYCTTNAFKNPEIKTYKSKS